MEVSFGRFLFKGFAVAKIDSQNYYWFKCDHEFFRATKVSRISSSKSIDFDKLTDEEKRQICALAIQAVYVKLLAESCTHGGELLYTDGVPYDDEGIAEVIGCPTVFMNFATERLKKLLLFDRDKDGKIILPEINRYMGHVSGMALRRRYERGQTGTFKGQLGTDGENVPKRYRVQNLEERELRGTPKPPTGSVEGRVGSVGVKSGRPVKREAIVEPNPPKVERALSIKMASELLLKMSDNPEDIEIKSYAKLLRCYGEEYISRAIDEFMLEIEHDEHRPKEPVQCLYKRIYYLATSKGIYTEPKNADEFAQLVNQVGIDMSLGKFKGK